MIGQPQLRFAPYFNDLRRLVRTCRPYRKRRSRGARMAKLSSDGPEELYVGRSAGVLLRKR